MKLTNDDIKRLQAVGFKRWTKGNIDRLYIDATKLGLELTYYNTGNISSASFDGESMSNCMARKVKSTKVWINVEDGTVSFKWTTPSSTGYEERLAKRAEELMNETLKDEEEGTTMPMPTRDEYKLDDDIKMTIAALLIMDGVTLEETTDMANKMLHDLDSDDQPAGLVIAKNSIALDHVAPIVGRYNYATECIDKGFTPADDYMKVKEEIDTIINGIKTKEQDEDEVKTTDEEEGTTMTKKVYMGTLNRELQKLNDQLAEDYGNRYMTIHDGATYDDIVACEVSWPSVGAVTPEEATGFAGQLMTAISMAKSFIFNGWEVTFDKNEDEGEAYIEASQQAEQELEADIATSEDEDELYDPYYLLKYCDYDELTDEQKALIDEYDARHEELTAAALEDDDIDIDDEFCNCLPAWADYDIIDNIAIMMMNDDEKAWNVRDKADTLQARYDGHVEASIELGTTPSPEVITLMRNCHALRLAAAIMDMHAPVVPTITPEDASEILDMILPY